MMDTRKLAAAALVVGGAYYYWRQQQSADTATTDTSSSDATGNNGASTSPWSAISGLFTDDQAPPELMNVDTEQTNVLQDTVNSLRNLVTGNNIAEVIEAGTGYLKVRRPDGSVVVLRGSRNWRNNNPGNIEAGNYAISQGAIGSDGRFAVFPNYDLGRRAKEKLIFEGNGYKNLTLADAIARYAPPGENNTSWYQKIVLAAVGGANKVMSAFTSTERDKIMTAMEKVEGFKPGTVTQVG
jgi:hypothetical protein